MQIDDGYNNFLLEDGEYNQGIAGPGRAVFKLSAVELTQCVYGLWVWKNRIDRVTMTFVLPDRPIQPSFRLAREGGSISPWQRRLVGEAAPPGRRHAHEARSSRDTRVSSQKTWSSRKTYL
jgi:hypothetical protein